MDNVAIVTSEVKQTVSSLSSGIFLIRNTVWNLLGQGMPLIVAIICIPRLIEGLGTERFGVLTMSWMVIGYFSLFDLGLGRALTKMVAEKLSAGEEKEIPSLVNTALFLMLALGVAGAIILGSFSSWLVYDVLEIPEDLQSETLYAFWVLSVAVPIVIITTGLRGVLIAKQRFGLLNAIRVPIGIFMFVGPLLVLPFSRRLFVLVAVLGVGRLIALIVYVLFCYHVLPVLRQRIVLKKSLIFTLLRFGSWMTVSNIVSPLMVYMDRFLIGALISVAAVAYYTTPYEVIIKVLIIPTALVGVLFPAFSSSFLYDPDRTTSLYELSLKYTYIILFPVILVTVTFAYEGIDFWLGSEFSQHSTSILQWLAFGVFINSFAQIPFTLIQGAGRPDITAKLHLLQLPVYLFLVWWLIGLYGIRGAAVAWVIRVMLDSVLLFVIAHRIVLKTSSYIRHIFLIVAGALIILGVACLLRDIMMKVFFLLLTMSVFALSVWQLLLNPEERVYLLKRLKIKLAPTDV